MDVYVARQPIFDRKMNIYGYELLYRRNDLNQYTGVDDDQATAELIYNSFLVMGLTTLTDGARAFINFSKDLLDSSVPTMLPRDGIVIEVLERDEATPATLEACRRMRAEGYMLALDDFVPGEVPHELIALADIIKVEYPAVSLEEQRRLITRYKPRIRFLAEKIETREDYRRAVELGYDYFQGYFFSKPAMVNSREIASLDQNLFDIIRELNAPEPDYAVISGIIERDLGLSFKLLKLANSVYLGARFRIQSIRQALSYIGTREMHQWISLMMLKELQNVENTEMVRLSLIRGKLMSLMACELDLGDRAPEFFFAGIFSFIDVLLGRPMEHALEGLPLSQPVRQALLGQEGPIRSFLHCVRQCEAADWEGVETLYPMNLIGSKQYMKLYLESLRWAKALNYT